MKLIDKIWNITVLYYKKVKSDKTLNIKGRLFVHGKKGGVSFGKCCTVVSSESINPTSGFNHTHLTTWENGKIIIGNNVGISNANMVSQSSIIIEDSVQIGSGTKIWDLDFHPINYQERVAFPENKGISRPIVIKEGAFVGATAIILKGVTIGKRSVIGAGSVVTHDIPDDEVWAGNPVRFIKKIN